jgi:hypothetical protein
LPIDEQRGIEDYDSGEGFSLIQIAEFVGDGEVHEGAGVGNGDGQT